MQTDKPIDGAEAAQRRSERERTLTEKGSSYNFETKQKERLRRMKSLRELSDKLSELLTKTRDTSFVKTEYTKWLSYFEDLLLTHQACLSLLTTSDDRLADDEEFLQRSGYFRTFKQSVEEWFSKHYVLSTVSEKDRNSSVITTSTKASSHLSIAKMKERQRKVELLARASALAEKQVIEAAKLKLKIKEEEFEIKTELQVSDARTKVLEELEREEASVRDQQLDDIFSTQGETVGKHHMEPPTTSESRTLNFNMSGYGDQHEGTMHTYRATATTGNIDQLYVDAVRSTNLPEANYPLSAEIIIPPSDYRRPPNPSNFEPYRAPVFHSADTRILNDVDTGLRTVARELNKPKADIQKFDGNPMDYNRFLRQFDARISANTDSYDERINFLMQYTMGEAYKIVSGYSHLDAKVGYMAALEEFRERYGDPETVAQAYVKKALEWPIVKQDSAKALDDYAIFLTECQYAVESVEAARVLEYSENLKLLVKKLPYFLHEKWRNIVYDIKERKQVVRFQHLVTFVRKEAKKAIDPIYGKEVMNTPNTTTRQSNKFTGPRKNFATTATESKCEHLESMRGSQEPAKTTGTAFTKPCLFCQGSFHSLDTCRGIAKQPLKDRYAFLKSKGLCFACLKSGHRKGDCRQKSSCNHCKKPHPSVLHLEFQSKQGSEHQDNPIVVTSSATRMGAGNIVHQALPIVPVRLKCRSSDKYVETYAFLDSGSTATFCSEDIMRALKIEGKKIKLNLLTMGQEKVQSSYVVSGLEVTALSGENALDLPPVFTQPTLPVSRKDVTSSKDIQKWPHLRDISLKSIDSGVDLLIGVNVPKAMEPWDVIPSVKDGPFAVKNMLGWVVNGPLGVAPTNHVSSRFVSVNRIDARSVPSLEEQICNQFNYDFNERTIDDVPEPSKQDRHFLDVVSKSLTVQDGHYMLALPFKSENVSMPNNRKQAEQRLASIARRLERDEVFRSEYSNFMDKVINAGYAQKVPLEKLQQDDGRVWYLPHHGVYHPRKKKLRVVFDCAAKYGGTSLNDQLLQGPNLTNTLVGTLIRFRQEDIAVMGDIDSMFYQVRVPPEDASFLRFLWWENGDISKQVIEYQMVVHIFGATSSPSCANFALRQTAQDCKGHFNDEVINTILRNFYVDDCLKSVRTVNDAMSLVKDLQAVLNKGGFHIAKWISNSREVMSSIPASERAKEVMDLDLDQDILPIERVLGVQWCVESDVFRFKIVIKEQPLTRRGILSMVSSVYDPIGFLAPFMLKAKIILQELCRLRLGWDEKIPEMFSNQWCLWLQDLHKLSDFKVDRCMKPNAFGEVTSAQLHHFADASETGYGTVSYLRLENAEGKVHCSFIMGKSRVTPLKQTTIPRLELTAATVAVRTDKMLKNELDVAIHRTVFWTDSMAVLRYIRNSTSRFHTFVANRLAVIHEGSSPAEWHYVNTKINPADLASRGLPADTFLQRREWIAAPEFLWEAEEKWPVEHNVVSECVFGEDPEIKNVAVRAIISSLPTPETDEDGVNKLINHHSSWFTLKRSVAWILKVRRELLRRVRFKGTKVDYSGRARCDHETSRDKVDSCESKRISVQDMNDAESAILGFVQGQAFAAEIEALEKGQSCVKRSSFIRKLDPVMDNGLLRVGGRLHRSSMPAESKHPVILPKNHHVSILVLRQIHHDQKHSGRNHMLSCLRQRYWLIHASTAIRKLISKCVVCRRQQSQVGEQKMASLPVDRLTPDEPPFTRVGVDYFGPFEVKQRCSHVKRYGVLFTCLASRAVHLEVAASLDTSSYINALRRFVARRGQVAKMHSDNGTNFVGAERELAEAIRSWNMLHIHDSMLQRNVDWQFNPPAGSHHGGVWDRMIRMVRKVMDSVLREQTLDDEGLHTLMCETESTINDRPITNISDQHGDLEALTPNHLLTMKRKPNLPPGVFDRNDNYCKRRWKQVQYMANLFWQRWVHEYLPLLQERQKWHEERRNLKVGDVVLVVDANAPRNSWHMGLVIETIPDRKGFVRQVKVKTSTSTLVRPINKLCTILEMD